MGRHCLGNLATDVRIVAGEYAERVMSRIGKARIETSRQVRSEDAGVNILTEFAPKSGTAHRRVPEMPITQVDQMRIVVVGPEVGRLRRDRENLRVGVLADQFQLAVQVVTEDDI